MIHVKPNRCGYSGYQCVGLAQLRKTYRGWGFTRTPYNGMSEIGVEYSSHPWSAAVYGGYKVTDEDPESTLILRPEENPDVVIDVSDSDTGAWADNYYNIPTNVRGIVMSVDYIPDMDRLPVPYDDEPDESGTEYFYRDLVPPEVACYANIENPELPDLFRTIYADATKVGLGSVQITGDLASYQTAVDRGYYELTSHDMLSYQDPDSCMEPGILDTMLGVPFSPVDLDIGPALGFDIYGILLSIIGINRWRIRVSGILSTLQSILSGIANAQGSSCEDITIEKISGAFLTKGTPRFRITAKNITVNGSKLAGTLTGTRSGAFNAYIRLHFSGGGSGTLYGYNTVTPSIVFSGASGAGSADVYISIGGVTETEVGNGYKLYRITQDRCTIDEDIIRTIGRGGILVRGDFGGKNAGSGDGGGSPYGVAETGNCDEEEQGS